MRWPWARRTEKRQTQALLTEAISRYVDQGGSLASIEATSAAETARGLLGRSLAMAAVTPGGMRTAGFSPDILNAIGRALIWPGEICFLLRVDMGGVALLPVANFDVYGTDADLSYWVAVNTATGGTRTQVVGAESVLHFKWGWRPDRWWRGVSPLAAAKPSGI